MENTQHSFRIVLWTQAINPQANHEGRVKRPTGVEGWGNRSDSETASDLGRRLLVHNPHAYYPYCLIQSPNEDLL